MYKLAICLSIFLCCVYASELQTQGTSDNDRCLCLTWNSNGVCIFCGFGKRELEQETALMLSKGCFCLGPWLGGTCIQWSGGSACTSGKRSIASENHALLATSVEMTQKGCYCVSQWLGGLCIQWGGGPQCTSGKRELIEAGNGEKCLCLTWNSNGICILCSFGRK
jgi:hypothetical protein